MPNRTQWDPDFSVGHDVIDAQHRSLMSQCNLLADHCLSGDSEEDDRRFDLAFDHLKALAREHFETEAALLASLDCPDLEDHRIECDEFEYLASEIATTENFNRLELQRFLALWWLGHIADSARQQRALVAGGDASA